MKKTAFLTFICLLEFGIAGTVASAKKPLEISRLFSHPRLKGSAPSKMNFSPDGKKLSFLWNESGQRFRDLYFATIPKGTIVRLTDLAGLPEDEREDDERSAEEKREAVELNRGITSAAWTRDAKQILFSYRGDFFLVEAKSGAVPLRLFHTSSTERLPSFSPDGEWLGYTRDNDIFVYNMRNGSNRQATRGGSSELRNGTGYYDSFVEGVFWSDDSKKIAFVQYDLSEMDNLLIPDYVKKKVKVTEQQREVAGGKLAYTKTGIVEIDSVHKLPVWLPIPSDEEYYLRSLDWSPNNRHLLLEILSKDQKSRHLVQCSVGDTTCDTLWRETDSCWLPNFAAQARYGREGKVIVFGSERSGWRHLYSIPGTPQPGGRTSPATSLTSGAWPVERWTISRDRSIVTYSAGRRHPSERELYALDLGSRNKRPLSAFTGWITNHAVSEDGRLAAFVFADTENPHDLFWTQTDGKKPPTRLTTSPLPEFAEYGWRKPHYIQIPSDDGKAIHAKVYYPDKFDPTRKYPLVVYVHGGGYVQSVHKAPWRNSDLFNRVLAQEDYVVLDLDYRGSKGYGRDWRVGVYRHVGGKDLDDEVTGVKHLIRQGFIDSTRVGIWGWSYGGFMTNMAMFKAPDVFKVGCSVAAVNDWENYNLWYTTARFNFPEDDSTAYKRSSPIHFAEGLKGKLLLIHGMKDSNVHFQDMVQLTQELIKLGKDFDVMIYPRENHGFTRDASNIHVFEKILEYFNTHL